MPTLTVQLTEGRPLFPLGGGSLARKPLFPSPAAGRRRALHLPTVFADLTPRQKTQVLVRLLKHGAEETRNDWAKRDLSAERWDKVRTAYFEYICGYQQVRP